MSITVKVWADDEPKPDGLFNKTSCPLAPRSWFREEPEDAAGLYGLERGRGTRSVNVLDDAGKHHRFTVYVDPEFNVTVSRVT